MANRQLPEIKTVWIRDYHLNDRGDQSGTSSVIDVAGNCPRCGKELPTHEHQDNHSNKTHLQ